MFGKITAKAIMEIEKKHVICLTPVYDDWDSFSILINNIEKEFSDKRNHYSLEIVAIDDCSIQEFNINDFSDNLPIEIVSLKKNIGHQRAIAAGLQYINDSNKPFDYLIVLDSDGEDRPEDIIELIRKCETAQVNKITFAERKKRKESMVFKTGYFFYKHFFYWLTGHKISFGNFSCIPKKLLKKVVVQDNLWNHYSGCIIQSKIPYDTVLLDRGNRYRGKSKMNFTSLVLHGLSSISVYFDSLSVRILKLSVFSIILCFFAVLIILYKKLFTDSAIPGWASNLTVIIVSIILQFASVTLIVLLMQLSSRKNVIIPSTIIYKGFIEEIFYNKLISKEVLND